MVIWSLIRMAFKDTEPSVLFAIGLVDAWWVRLKRPRAVVKGKSMVV